MLRWSLEKRKLELKYTWKIARNASDEKTNLLVSAGDGQYSGMGEAAPNVRYDESPEQCEREFARFLEAKPADLRSVQELTSVLSGLSLSASLRFAIESAFVHYISRRDHLPVHAVLNIPPASAVPISFSIPIMDIGSIRAFFLEHDLKRFRFIKLKVNADEMRDAVEHLSTFCESPLLIDANEAFHDVEACIRVLEKLKKKNIEFIEQPMPASMTEESVYLKKYSPFPLFADESITGSADFGLLRTMFSGVNVKLMKAGGYLNGIRLLKEAKLAGLRTMIGCMVETTLGISSGLYLTPLTDYADLDSFLVLKNEPFGLVEESEGEIRLAQKSTVNG